MMDRFIDELEHSSTNQAWAHRIFKLKAAMVPSESPSPYFPRKRSLHQETQLLKEHSFQKHGSDGEEFRGTHALLFHDSSEGSSDEEEGGGYKYHRKDSDEEESSNLPYSGAQLAKLATSRMNST